VTENLSATNIAKPWKGLLASLIFSGAGQFFSGSRTRGIIWTLILVAGPLCSLLVCDLTFLPAQYVLLFFCGGWMIAWLLMLFDSYRPIATLRWWGWIVLVIASLGVSESSSYIAHKLFHVYRIPTSNMVPTFQPGDQVLVSRSAYWFHKPARGDLIVFDTKDIHQIPQDPSGKEVMFVERLVGLPGDRIEIVAPGIWINGVETRFGDPNHPIEYTSASHEVFSSGTQSFAVPSGGYFVLGDKSANSFDSRYWGVVPFHSVYGKVTGIYWPWGRITFPR
jgi:signal peptidase I